MWSRAMAVRDQNNPDLNAVKDTAQLILKKAEGLFDPWTQGKEKNNKSCYKTWMKQ